MLQRDGVWTTAGKVLKGVLGGLVLLCALGSPAAAAAPGDGDETPEGAAERFKLFGYLNQAYVKSDGNQLLGIPKRGTADYRSLALQLRYSATEEDQVVVQLSHERLGESPLQKLKSDVQLDWAFYQRRLGEETSVRIGRFALPVGIYNEIHYVGTILPFYRPPSNLYGEISFASETGDGIVLFHRFTAGSPWSLEADAYFGHWQIIEDLGGLISTARINNGAGAQLWLSTPVPGLRFGLAGQRFSRPDGEIAQQSDHRTVVVASADGSFDRVQLRGEYRKDGGFHAYYGEASYRLTPKLALSLQHQAAFVSRFEDPQTRINREVAAGVSYRLRAGLVLKAEAHQADTIESEKPITPFGSVARVRYGILSLSTSF
jgi:hypothetical protein